MKYLDLLKSSARQTITSKLFWLYLGITVLLIPFLVIKSLFYVIWFLDIIASLIFITGLVYAISQKESHHIDISVPDGLRMGWSKFLPTGLINIFLLILFFSDLLDCYWINLFLGSISSHFLSPFFLVQLWFLACVESLSIMFQWESLLG